MYADAVLEDPFARSLARLGMTGSGRLSGHSEPSEESGVMGHPRLSRSKPSPVHVESIRKQILFCFSLASLESLIPPRLVPVGVGNSRDDMPAAAASLEQSACRADAFGQGGKGTPRN